MKSITVVVHGDDRVEADETCFLDLVDPQGGGSPAAALFHGESAKQFEDVISATGTILNDDSATIGIEDVAIEEGDEGQTVVHLTLSLSAESDFTTSVGFQTVDDSATIEDEDYESASGEITFSPGQRLVQVMFVIVADEKIEFDEQFSVEFSVTAGQNVDLLTDRVLVGIINDDVEQGLHEVNVRLGFVRNRS
jgi:hypothetical protein